MLHRITIALITSATSLSALGATTLVVRLSPQNGAQSCVTGGTFEVSHAGKEIRFPASQVLSADGSFKLPIQDSGTPIVRFQHDGCWAPSTVGDGDTVVIDVWRVAHVGGVLDVARGSRLTEFNAFIVQDNDEQTLKCSLHSAEWQCDVPAGTPLVLRLQPRGFAPVFYWDVTSTIDKPVNLGTQTLSRGASIAGWIQDPTGHPLGKARVVVSPIEPRTRDQRRAAALQRVTFTNARGFFQIVDVSPGSYTLISHFKALAPAEVPRFTVREGESLVWHRAIRHSQAVGAQILVDPPTARDSKPWTIRLQQKAAVLTAEPALCRTDSQGQCTVDSLRPDTYIIAVQDDSGSVISRTEANLATGTAIIPIDAHGIVVHGVVKAGDEPLAADLIFENDTGKVVRSSSDKDGTFEGSFPSAGDWKPTVNYPRGSPSAMRLRTPSVHVRSREEAPNDLEIALPGGRLKGTVVNAMGEPQTGGVHLDFNSRRLANQRLSDGGTFDLIGLDGGTYQISAEGEKGATRSPVNVDLADEESKTIELVLDPYRVVVGSVRNPGGEPASGAVVRYSDDGSRWTSHVADSDGMFKLYEPASTATIYFAAVTYDYPTTIARLAPGQDQLTIVLASAGGIVRAPAMRKPWFVSDGAPSLIPSYFFNFPEPYGRFNGGIYLAAGRYQICPTSSLDDRCQLVTVTANSDQSVDFQSQAHP